MYPQQEELRVSSIETVEWKRLSAEMKRRNWTQNETAVHLHVTQPTISDWKGGRVAPKPAIWPKLARFLRLTVPELGAEIGAIFFTIRKNDIYYNANLSKNNEKRDTP